MAWILPVDISSKLIEFYRLSSIMVLSMLVARLSLKKVSDLSSRVPELTSSVVSPVLVCFQSMTKPSFSCLARSSQVDLVKQFQYFQS